MIKCLFVATKYFKSTMKLSDEIIKIIQFLPAPESKQAQEYGANQE